MAAALLLMTGAVLAVEAWDALRGLWLRAEEHESGCSADEVYCTVLYTSGERGGSCAAQFCGRVRLGATFMASHFTCSMV